MGGRLRCTETGCCAESFLEHGSVSLLPSLSHRDIASNPSCCIFRSRLWYQNGFPAFEGEPRTLCLRDPAPNVMAFGKQQITGDSRECAAYFPFMTASGQRGANGCMFEYVAVGLQSSYPIVWEQE